MTNLKDILNDLITESIAYGEHSVKHMTLADIKDHKENLIEEYEQKINKLKEIEYANR